MAMKAKHAFGSSAQVLEALNAGKINEFDILFLDGDTKPKIGWIDSKKNFRLVENEEKVVVVDVLPSVGEVGKIYIFGEDAFVWVEDKFVNLCKPTDVTELQSSIKALEELIAKNAKESKSYADEKISKALDEVENSYAKIKYEVTDVPVGTLIDYRDAEIRILCPENSVFVEQSVGTGGDSSCYYCTFKTFAPCDEAVGYIEHLNGQVDEEVLTDLKTDAYNRRYQPTWLALAKYDANADVWNYYGKNSSEEKMIGYDYQIDWYDINGVMIASDSVRISLSNEECHFVNEPYYVGKIKKEFNTKIEERIAEVESAYEVIEF